MSDPCPICGFCVDPSTKVCSEFCLQVSPEEVAAFKSMKPGNFGAYPCPGCGSLMEDTYEEGDGAMCSSCFTKKRSEEKRKLLVEAERLFSLSPSASDAEINLLSRIRKELAWGK